MIVDGKEITLSNLNKVMYPKTGFTKGQVIEYYREVAPYILPHLKDRPITLKRFPDGVSGEYFYEKRAPSHAPRWIKTFAVGRRSENSVIDYILINDLPTLMWSANMANLEMHPFLGRAPHLDQPTMIVFDLDPGEGADILRSCEAAFLVKDLLDRLDLEAFVKVSGSKGIHLHVPLNGKISYEASQPFAKSIAQTLENEHPRLIVSEMPKARRKGKVLVDWSQNSEHKSTAAVYSLRARIDGPFAALPVTWDELNKALKSKDLAMLFFRPDAALERVKKLGDLFEPLLKLKQNLPRLFLDLMKRSRSAGSLETYRRKRDFSKTSEPAGTVSSPQSASGEKLFVIQKHAATRLHYDFRLEMDGTLKSWAVPKGPPYELSERRLAVAVEDHPMDYARFEGVIPKGEYGGGTVMVWDIGTYELMDGNYSQGKLHFLLRGKKLEGEWILVKGRDDNSKNNTWYLIKGGEGMARVSEKTEDSSALTGRSMEKIAKAADAVWHSNRDGAERTAAPVSEDASEIASLPRAKIKFVEPMLARSAAALPKTRKEWFYEIKLDGYRCLIGRDSNGVKIWSRRGITYNKEFPQVAEAGADLPMDTLVDGEVVALDQKGRPSFNLLQHRRSQASAIRFYAFDILVYRGRSIMGLELAERRGWLARSLADAGNVIQILENFETAPSKLVRAAKDLGFEGVVAKRKNSLYEAGRRSGAWLKFKTHQGQELVIGGYTSGNPFDALVVGYYENGSLRYASKVRNGFVPRLRREVMERLKPLETDVCPFANLPEEKRTPWALTKNEMKKCIWLRPELVAQIEFTSWTPDGHLRLAAFAGLRDDKKATEVVRESESEN